jgi:SWI/SNF-related matrix-associated actin-dependent regulator of chromatin subfamily D
MWCLQPSNERILKIWISNTAKDQPWQNADRPLDENAFDFDMGQIPTFRVRLEGRLIDPDTNELPPPEKRRHFTSFFKQITFELDRDKDLYPDGNLVEWKRTLPQPGQAPFEEKDAIEFERKGDVNVNLTVKLVLDASPERYKLSAPLADLLDTKEDTRTGIVMALWEYVRFNGLQDPDDKRWINCDEALKNVCILSWLSFVKSV